MSTISARCDEATDLLFGRFNDVNGPVVVRDRPGTENGGDVAVLIDDACLWGVSFFDGWKV